MITFFDYAVKDQDGPNANPTGFFDVSLEGSSSEDTFRSVNQQMLEWVVSMTDEEMAKLSQPMRVEELDI